MMPNEITSPNALRSMADPDHIPSTLLAVVDGVNSLDHPREHHQNCTQQGPTPKRVKKESRARTVARRCLAFIRIVQLIMPAPVY